MANTTLANLLLRRLHTQYVQQDIQYFTTEHRGRGPNVVVPGTGQFLNSTCIRTNQSRKSIRYSAVIPERSRRQRRNTRTIGQQKILVSDSV